MNNDEQSIDDSITSHVEPGPRDTSEHGDPHSLAWSADIGKIAGAYARAQASMGVLVASHKAKIKTNKGADFEYSFANIADALKACLGAFNAEGCAVLQPVTTFKGGVEVRTVVIHESGQWLRSGILVLPAHGDAQAIGSAITYARRYQILGMVGLAPSDDDGATATASARSGSGQNYEHRTSRRTSAPDPAPQQRADLCAHETASAIGTLCGQIAQHVGRDDVDRLTVLRTALSKTGHQYNDGIQGPKNLTRGEALAVHPWLLDDLANYGDEDDQRQPGEDRGAP